MTTGVSFEGYEVTEFCGLLYGEVVVPNGLLGALATGTFFTIDALATARKNAIESLISQAQKKKADGIIGIDIDISDLNGNGVLVSANGTSVKLRKKRQKTAITNPEIYLVDKINAIQLSSCLIEFDFSLDFFTIRIQGEARKRLTALSVHAGINTIFDESVDIGRLVFADIVYDTNRPRVFFSECRCRISDLDVQEIKTLLIAIEKCVIGERIYSQDELIAQASLQTDDASLSSYWEDIQMMHGAIEICDYLKKAGIKDDRFQDEVFPKLESLALYEKMYGNRKKECLEFIQKFIR